MTEIEREESGHLCQPVTSYVVTENYFVVVTEAICFIYMKSVLCLSHKFIFNKKRLKHLSNVLKTLKSSNVVEC